MEPYPFPPVGIFSIPCSIPLRSPDVLSLSPRFCNNKHLKATLCWRVICAVDALKWICGLSGHGKEHKQVAYKFMAIGDKRPNDKP